MQQGNLEFKVSEWEEAAKVLDGLKRELNRVEREYKNAEIALGNLLIPEKATYGDKFHVWVFCRGAAEGRLLTITKVDSSNVKIKWEGK